MADNTTRALYQALADFSNLKREARNARRELGSLKASEDAYNAASLRNRRAATTASVNRQKAVTAEVNAMRVLTGLLGRYSGGQVKLNATTRLSNAAIEAQNRALATNITRLVAAASAARAYAQAQQSISRDVPTATTNIRQNTTNSRAANTRRPRFTPELPSMAASDAAAQYAANARRAEQETTRWGRAVGWLRREFNELHPAMARANSSANTLQRGFQRFANWRPRLTPPFVALIPIIASVAAGLNPLISLMGSVGAAAFGLASNIASLSGVFLALPGILSAVVGGITSVIAAMGGVGNVFKTYSAMKKAAGAGGTAAGAAGESAAERADRLARAELNLAKAQRNVQKAQQNLNKAREQALKDLQDLRIEVGRASLNEERAIANLIEARDNYNNVMADPGSQAGDKADAAVRIKEAEAELEDVRRRNVEAQKELTEAERRGVEGSEQVLDAKENLQDAILDERDAQRDLKKEYAGTAAGASALTTATNEYDAALAKLSPSARTFVLALLALEDQWNAMRSSLQEAFFSEFVDQIGTLPQIIQNIGNFLRPAASSMGRFVDSFLRLLSSPEWTADLNLLGESNGRILDSMGRGAISLMNAIKDLTIAAAPFTEWLVDSLAIGAENFADLVESGRRSGDLAAWLEKVADRLELWWNIVKNIGETLFNYGAASSGFGDWLSQGFLETTEGWKKNSEEAREEGSKFQQFLKDIEPLLSNVNGMFGDFFGWLGQEIMDPDNIDDANDLVTLLRDDLGPAIGGFLDALAETDIDEALVKAISAIVESLTSIIEAGGGAGFEAFFDTIVLFFEALADLLSNMSPDSVSWLMSLLGVLAGAAFVGKFTGLTNAVGWLLKLDKAKFTGALSLLGKMGIIGAAATGGVLTGQTLGGGIGAAQAGGQALSNNDGQGALDALTVNGDLARTALAPLGISQGLDLIGMLFGPDAQAEIDTWFQQVSISMTQGIADIQAGWGDGVFNQIWEKITTGWDTFSTNLRMSWDTFWGITLPVAWNTFTLWLGEQWNGFWGGIKANWDTFWLNLRMAWETFWGVTIPLAWTNFTLWLGGQWTSFWTGLGAGLDGMVTWFGQIWNRLGNLFKDPINWVIQAVYNDGIRRLWNDFVAKPFGWTQLGAAPLIGGAPAAAGGGGGRANQFRAGGGTLLPGYSPGMDNHHYVDQYGNQLHLSGGEAVMRPEFAKAVGGEQGVKELNSRARRGEAFKDGGIFGKKRGTGGVWEVAGDMWEKFQGFFKNPLGWITDVLMGGNVRGNINAIAGQSQYGGLISRIPIKAIENLAGLGRDRAKTAKRKADPDLAGGGAAPANVMGWRAQWAAVKAAFPGASLNSAYRPGARTVNGGLSYHGSGRAIDTNPSMAIFNWIRKNYPNSRELIYSPAGAQQLQNGRNHLWGGAVRNTHWDHVHWAMRQGGVIPKLYDQGGWLPNGGAAVNRSGKPEAVLTAAESQALKGLLAGSGLSSGSPLLSRGPGAVSSLRGTAQQVNDYSVNVGSLTINNPAPEAPSVSLPKAIRQIGYMQNARANS